MLCGIVHLRGGFDVVEGFVWAGLVRSLVCSDAWYGQRGPA